MSQDHWKLINFERVLPYDTERAVFDVEFQSGLIVRGIMIVPSGNQFELRNADELPPLLRVPVTDAAVVEIRNRPKF
ncbi:hypothetical protein [Mesorhizobium sp.]|uniref:hypothetical protein n=1 Tax=Mesorhizobium sp. TaxID=1871066 RepID=UPI000FEA397F|nr:hypothetical protein [Mesorhizobium sp.]RWF62548.1 MAG: hypothetical protein EOS47_22990 [Mesorhizobium sp.]TIT43836.1 MAG: hypothetical protein E5W76_04990 [Mesorhizobium sp.]